MHTGLNMTAGMRQMSYESLPTPRRQRLAAQAPLIERQIIYVLPPGQPRRGEEAAMPMNLLKKTPIQGRYCLPGMEIINPRTGGIVEVLSVLPPATGLGYWLNTTGGRLLIFADETILLTANPPMVASL